MIVKSQMLFFLLFFILGFNGINREINDISNSNRVLKSAPGAFIAQTLYAYPNTEEHFLSHLKSKYLPIWSRLNTDSTLSELCVFKLAVKDSTKKDQKQINYLILAQLKSGVNPEEFLQIALMAKNQNPKQKYLYRSQRTEILHCTQNAYFPAINLRKNVRMKDIVYLIEFIAVKDSADFVNQYHALMQKYFGPLNGLLVNEGKLHSIFMLETTKLIHTNDSRFNWNQLHVSGDYPEFVDINWDSLYTDQFKRTFSCELDSVWALLPPFLDTSFDCTGTLVKDLHVK